MAKTADAARPPIAVNRKARFDYFIEERFEAGIALLGWEVKSMRAGKAQIAEAYVAHEEALATWARRTMGAEDGDPLEEILAHGAELKTRNGSLRGVPGAVLEARGG